MEPKKIYIAETIKIQKWADDNRETIMNTLYDNLFEFAISDDESRVVLKLITGSSGEAQRGRIRKGGYNIEFIISKSDMDETIDNLLSYMTEIEEYEKCTKLINLRKSISN